MSSAIIGLIGVVVGGGIAAFVQLRSSARSVRGSARLLREELDLTLVFVESVLKEASWPPRGPTCSNELWLDRRSLLAMELGRRDWVSVKSAYQAVETIRGAAGLADEPLSTDARPRLEGAAEEVRVGRDTLDNLSGPLPAITQAWRRRRYG